MRPVDESECLSTYEALSQRVGFFSKESVTIPPLHIAKNLLRMIETTDSMDAAEAVMKIVRFSPSPKTDDEREAKKLCCEASQKMRTAMGG